MTRVDELADELEHAIDVLGGVRPMIGLAHVETGHELEVDVLVLGCELGLGHAFRSAARAMILSSTSVTLLTYVTSKPDHSR